MIETQRWACLQIVKVRTIPIVAMLVRRASPVVEFIEFVRHAVVRNDQVRDHHGESDGD